MLRLFRLYISEISPTYFDNLVDAFRARLKRRRIKKSVLTKGYFLLLLHELVSIIVIAWEDENEGSFYREKEEIKKEGKTISVWALRLLLCRATFSEVVFPIVRTPKQNLIRRKQILPQLRHNSRGYLRVNFSRAFSTRIYSIAKIVYSSLRNYSKKYFVAEEYDGKYCLFLSFYFDSIFQNIFCQIYSV